MKNLERVRDKIVSYSAEHKRLVLSWIDSTDTLRQIGGGGQFPPSDDTVDRWQTTDVVSYLLFSEGQPVAYGELRARPAELAVEIGHLLVAPSHRFMGHGGRMLNLLSERALKRPGVQKVLLRFRGEESQAPSWCERAGFQKTESIGFSSDLVMSRPGKYEQRYHHVRIIRESED